MNKDSIFVILGSQKFQFDRLLRKIDDLIMNGAISANVYAQIGYSEYVPKSFDYIDFMSRESFVSKINDSQIIITHGGTGAIISAVKAKKKVIAIPRLSKYLEHVDDHQIQIIDQFSDMGIICPCYEIEELYEKILVVKENQYNQYLSNTNKIIESIEALIMKWF